eukprot:COSAG02_NODE_70631_length_194_cov_158.578947_1_plen_41_part_10
MVCWIMRWTCLRTVLTFPRIGVVNKQAMEQHLHKAIVLQHE